ncbi:MAG: transcriptional repressor [Candidatus Thermoplasmatota archaeon]|jgi:Fe2+ or Zn2+ uptake regulation protein|nr:transcriptional repressor [Candidatus Thermoplasmatota archaeon]MCL5955039.1 transcriptional repressor [Candidatus Thermoplasmatota archaeon]
MEKEYYIDSLKKSNFKITPQRLCIIDYVMDNTPGHFTADEIFSNVKGKEPTITLATVYNILKALHSAGTIKSFEINGTTWFETNTEFHGNVICAGCGKISDVDVDRNSLISSVETTGFEVSEANLLIKGLCRDCRRHPNA